MQASGLLHRQPRTLSTSFVPATHGCRQRSLVRQPSHAVRASSHVYLTHQLDVCNGAQQSHMLPAWHPQVGSVFLKRTQLERAVGSYYHDVWNEGTTDALEQLVTPGVCFNDVFGFDGDAFGRAGLRDVVHEVQGSHPLLHFQVDSISIDEQEHTAVAHYTATAAQLLLRRDGTLPTGEVSTVHGVDKFRFNLYGQVTSIEQYRDRFAGEEMQYVDWDTA
eukprot:GHRR01001022.1.p1 GENE.GHRR01001022.1~~GHRR01001022.1.p1  ORF type:complete len:220 (+),score=35.52 GHRR01001022.1:189-848(+)